MFMSLHLYVSSFLLWFFFVSPVCLFCPIPVFLFLLYFILYILFLVPICLLMKERMKVCGFGSWGRETMTRIYCMKEYFQCVCVCVHACPPFLLGLCMELRRQLLWVSYPLILGLGESNSGSQACMASAFTPWAIFLTHRAGIFKFEILPKFLKDTHSHYRCANV